MIIAGACSAVAALALASTASAITSEGVEVSVNGGAFTTLADAGTINPVTDNGPGDLNPQVNVIRALFNFDGLTISLNGDAVDNTATAQGTATPIMTIVIQGSVAAGDTIEIRYSANGFSLPPSGDATVSHQVNGAGGDYMASEATYTGATDNLYDISNPLGAPIPSIGPVNTRFTGGPIPAGTSNPYSITIDDIITGTGAPGTMANDISVTTSLTVPDGGSTLLMLGSALSVLGFYAFRRKAVKA